MDQHHPGDQVAGPIPGWSAPRDTTGPIPGWNAPREVLERPVPAIASLGGAVAAILLGLSLDTMLGELDGDHRRLLGIVLSLGFEVIGLAIVWLARGRRMATAGLGLSAVGVVPLVGQIFIDPTDAGFDSSGDFTTTLSGVLVVLAALWLVAYAFGPGRRYALYLGAALLAVWLVAVIQVVDEPLGALTDPFVSTSEEFLPIDPSFDDSSSFSTTDDFDDSYSYSYEYESEYDPGSTMTELGLVSLVFGAGYLVLGAWRDRVGDARMATPCLAAAIPILFVAVSFLSADLDVAGTAFFAMALGACGIYVGAAGARRFTAWTGVAAMAIGIVVLVSDVAGDSAPTTAVALLVVGLAIAGGLFAVEPESGDGRPPSAPLPLGPEPPGPAAPTGPTTTWPASPPTAPPAGSGSWPAPPDPRPAGPAAPTPEAAWAPPPEDPPAPTMRRDGAPPSWPPSPDAGGGPFSR